MKANRSILLPLAIVFGILFTQATPAFAQGNDSASALDGVTWYVATTGNNGNDCLSSSTPCATIQAAIDKSASGDTINVAGGTYTGTGTEVVLINKSITLSGGWDADFTSQSDISIIDGQLVRQGINNNSGNSESVVIDHFTVQNGFHANQGGGIRSVGTLTLSNSIVSNNISEWMGGGVYSSGILTINNTNISGNTAGEAGHSGGGGGGGLEFKIGTVVINNSSISNNKIIGAFSGSGISLTLATLTLNNSTISSNTGGVNATIYISNGNAILKNSTVSNNQLYGVYAINGSATLQNTIIANNGVGGDCRGTVTSSGYNLISNIMNCTYTSAIGDLINVNPLLGPLTGSPGYLPLLGESPAIDAGNPDVPGSGGNACLAMDQRGATRPQGNACDIGAHEYYSITISGNAGTDDVTFNYAENDIPKIATSDENGNYSFILPAGWSGTVMPSKLGWSFAPDYLDYNNILSDQQDQNYIATRYAYVISGNIGLPGVTLSYEDNGAKSVVSGSDGDYALPVSFGWSGNITPSLTGYSFSPGYIEYTNVSADFLTQDYTPTAITFIISGNAGIAGAVLNYKDSTPKIALTDDNGFYSFPVSYNWSGTVTPSYFGYTISPANKTYNNVLSDQLSQNYDAIFITIPTILLPKGANIDQTPTFKWTKILGATQYQYQLYKGNTRIYAKTVPANVCTLTTCLDTPTTKIMDGKYKWQVRAFVNGAWQPYTSFKPFTMGPKVGYWSGRGNDFYVVPNQSRIENFAIYIQVSGCGSYQIMHPNRINIVNQSFAFGSSFYANGTFRNTHTRATGTVGLNNFYIPGCGYVSGGPFSWVSNWIDGSQPTFGIRESGIPAIMDLPGLLDQHPTPFIFTVDPE